VNTKKARAEAERDKAMMTVQDMIAYLSEHPEAHTPFMDRWCRLCIEHNRMIYPAKPHGAAAGRRLLYGKKGQVIECIESCERYGKPGVWFVKTV
jgi:hypothetical protein